MGTVSISAHPLTTLELNLLVCLSVCPHYIRSVCACVSVFVMVVIPVTQAPCVTSLGTGQTFFSCCVSAMCLCAGVSHGCAEAESGVTGGEECLSVCVCVLAGSV